MNLDSLMKYIIWIGFFMVAVAGIYFMLKRLGVMG